MTPLSTLPSTREQAHHALLLLGVPAPVRVVAEVHAALFDGDLSVRALAALLRDEERTYRDAGPTLQATEPWLGVGTPGAFHTPSPHAGGSDAGVGTSGEFRASGGPGWGGVGPDGGATAWTGAEAGHGGTSRSSYLICPGLNLDLTPARGIVTLGAWPVAERICSPAVARADALAIVVRIAEIAPVRPGACTAALLRHLAAGVPGGPEAFDPLNPAALADVARAALDDPALADALAAEEPARAAAAERAAGLGARQRLFGVPAVPHQRGRA
jgi:hypothetical protein